jgi:hypothetical protein
MSPLFFLWTVLAAIMVTALSMAAFITLLFRFVQPAGTSAPRGDAPRATKVPRMTTPR